MKRILLFSLLIIIIPLLFYFFFYSEKEIKFDFIENRFVRVLRSKTGIIEVIPLEEYIVGVVSGEMPVYFDDEALKAQAVASRSYVLKKIEQNNSNSYDVDDTTNYQVYLDNVTLKKTWGNKYIENINKVRNVVLCTRGEYLTYNGEVIYAFFFSTSVGKTENSEDMFSSALPYLRSVDSSWDKDVSPVFSEKKDLSLIDFYKKLNINFSNELIVEKINTTSTGRIKKLNINGRELLGGDVVSLLGIRSSYFDIVESNGVVSITTKGFGHGVGMSQYGAFGMAMQGYKYDEILSHYYLNTKLEKK